MNVYYKKRKATWGKGFHSATNYIKTHPQAGIKFSGRSINNFRYADDTSLMAESEEELNSLLMRVNEESEKVVLNFNITEN